MTDHHDHELDDDTLDGCSIDFTEHADDHETAELRALFPDGDPSTADAWREVLGHGA